ncbi:MAG: dTMP kinase [Parachlamydiaceae bacterium]|nr:dTMP kinase [Parachlamydiaceae bacterium]
MSLKKGLFLAFEGGEGAGKTTVVDAIAESLASKGLEVVKTHEPGVTGLGKEIRKLLLQTKEPLAICAKAELLLFLASRAQNIEEVIKPALARGAYVLCDRFNDSTLAYQGEARGLGIQVVKHLCDWVCEDILPDLTFFLAVDPLVGLERARKVGAFDRIEAEKADFHSRVQKGFQKIKENDPDHFTWIDASQTKDRVIADVWKIIMQFSIET